MVRKATQADLEALTRLRSDAAGTSAQVARLWLTEIVGLSNIFVVLPKEEEQPVCMLCAVPVHAGQQAGSLLCGMATRQDWRGRGLMTHLTTGCLQAFGAAGQSFAVTTPQGAGAAKWFGARGFHSAFPIRIVEREIAPNLWAQADFDFLTVRQLMEQRQRFQPGCITPEEPCMRATVAQLYSHGITLVSNARGYGLFYTRSDRCEFIELQAENDHSADVILQAVREKTGLSTAAIALADTQPIFLGEGRRCAYGMVCALRQNFSEKDCYFRLLLGE